MIRALAISLMLATLPATARADMTLGQAYNSMRFGGWAPAAGRHEAAYECSNGFNLTMKLNPFMKCMKRKGYRWIPADPTFLAYRQGYINGYVDGLFWQCWACW